MAEQPNVTVDAVVGSGATVVPDTAIFCVVAFVLALAIFPECGPAPEGAYRTSIVVVATVPGGD